MPWSSDNTIPSMKGKSLELRKLFAKVANEALDKGRTEEEAVFAGLAAVRNSEKAKSKQIKKEAPSTPSHLKAVLEAAKIKQESLRKASNEASEPVSKAEPIRQAFLPKNALKVEKERTLVSAEFDENNRLVLVFDTGEKIVTNPALSDEHIENHVIFEGGDNTGQATGEPTGFPNRTDSVISFDSSTRTFTIAPTSGQTFSVFLAAKEVSKGSESVVLQPTSGLHYIYFDSVDLALKATTTFNSDIFRKHAVVSIIYWRQDTLEEIYFADERHGIVMDGATHAHLHLSIGAQYRSGLALLNILKDEDGSLNTHAKFGVQNGAIADEDIEIQIVDNTPQDLSPYSLLPVYYRAGATVNWYKTTADEYPILRPGDSAFYNGLTRPAYNYETGGFWYLDEVPNNQYFLIHVLATNNIEEPVVVILGNTYSTKSAARDGANTELASITGLPFAEFVRMATVIYQTANSYTNSPKAKIVSTSEGLDYIDWRKTQTFIPGQSSSGGGTVELPANVIRGYYTEVTTVANTPLNINHNLGLVNRNSFTINATYNNQSVLVNCESINANSVQIVTEISVPLLCVTITGMTAV